MDTDFATAKSTAYDETSTLLAKIGAAAVILSNPSRSPVDTAWCQAGALYWLLKSDSSAKDFMVAAMDRFADRFCGLWRVHAARPWLSVEPETGAALLEDAIRSEGPGAARLIRLFKAADVAANVGFPEELGSFLEGVRRRG